MISDGKSEQKGKRTQGKVNINSQTAMASAKSYHIYESGKEIFGREETRN